MVKYVVEFFCLLVKDCRLVFMGVMEEVMRFRGFELVSDVLYKEFFLGGVK